MAVTEQNIRDAVRELGLSGKALCVHSSLRSFGRVDGGADTVIDGLLHEGCTLMAPTMCWDFAVGPPPHLRPAQNAFDYETWDREHPEATTPGDALVYTPSSQAISAWAMGAVPAAVLQRPGRVRGNHPMGSFTALGPLAHLLIDEQTPDDPFAPFRALEAVGGYVVLMGVGLDRLTLLHHAEELAGRNLFMRWANGPDGKPIAVRGGECSAGFPRLEPALAHVTREAVVGSSHWRVLPVAATLATAVGAFRGQPEITHCPDPDCSGCRDAILGGPILDGV
jgi:aminoglycoside 3-N-acetyltransferase